MRVLVTEDDRSVASALMSALTRAGHIPTHITRGSDLLLRHRDVDVVMLDLGLEDGDGLDALQRLRLVSDIPVIVVTARGDERSTVQALQHGADDYLVKPVRLHELLARIQAVTRRYAPVPTPTMLRVRDVTIDTDAHRVTDSNDADISLTPTEFALLTVIARRAGEVVSRQQLLDDVWGDAYAATSRSLDVHLAQLRQKLPTLTITTIRGFGYRMESS